MFHVKLTKFIIIIHRIIEDHSGVVANIYFVSILSSFFSINTSPFLYTLQVVIAMRDLFQVVFELKKKEVEMAKQQLERKSDISILVKHTTSATTDTKSKVGITKFLCNYKSSFRQTE